MAATQAQLDALENAYFQGVLTVEYGDKKVTYRSVEQMKQIINEMRKTLGLSSGTTRKYYDTSKGTT